MKKFIAKISMAILLAFSLLFGGSLLLPTTSSNPLIQNAYADEIDEDTENNENTEDNNTTTETTPEGSEESEESKETTTDIDEAPKSPDNPDSSPEETPQEPIEEVNSCQDQTGTLAWIVCPGTGVIAKATDGLYNVISDMLIVSPISSDSDSPIYLIWQYARDITNIVFVIFILIVILSQVTGIGLNNYGIKRVLPRIIIAVILVNLSFIICAIAIDASNIIGYNLRGFFEGIQQHIIERGVVSTDIAKLSMGDLLEVVLSGGVIGGVVISALGGGGYIFFMLLTVLIGALIAVVTGLITISARHALIALLVMISPLAFVAYLLPNTEKWFNKWKDLLFRMLVFFPMFSFLFGASQLVGWTIIVSATQPFSIILGIGVQIFPLFFSWSLMKMSGTVLGHINSGLRRIATPVQRSLSGWSLSHAENRRQNHIANSNAAGAHLRRYLDSRRELRELDTHNAMEIRHGQATEYAFKTASSNRGLDKYGNMVWDERANRYTRNAKRANTYGTRARTAQSSYATTLASYGSKFTADQTDIDINAAGSFAGSNAMAQEYLAVNQAESDQKDLLDLYLKTANDDSSYQYHRLISNAAGTLGHNGESAILGQVIKKNSEIEARRRTEARIMINKFGVNKRQFRGMSFDIESMNDDGFELDEEGNVIENTEFRLLPGRIHREWSKYIGEHKVTKKRIDKSEYDSLSDAERANYSKIRYMEIKDDKGQVVQRVFEDDAGYMKELLRDDIAIGDPINARYVTEIGVAAAEGERTGILRRYHSTISTALNETKYKEHNATFTPMLTQQANNGYITSPGQANIGQLQSLNVASKAGPILVNDSYAIDKWNMLINSFDESTFRQKFPNVDLVDSDGNPVSAFQYFFPDNDVINYRDVNGNHLPGMKLVTDAEGNQSWEKVNPKEVDRMDRASQLELRQNFIKHGILPKSATKLVSTADRNMPPKVLEEQKDGTLNSLGSLITNICEINEANLDNNIPFANRLNGGQNILNTKNPSTYLQSLIQQYRKAVKTDEANNNPHGSSQSIIHSSDFGPTVNIDDDGNATLDLNGQNTIDLSSNEAINNLRDQLERAEDALYARRLRNDHQHIIETVQDLLINDSSCESIANSLVSLFEETETLRDLTDGLQAITDRFISAPRPTSTEEAISQLANAGIEEQERAQNMIAEVIEFIDLNHQNEI